jgi:hypothetical protein
MYWDELNDPHKLTVIGAKKYRVCLGLVRKEFFGDCRDAPLLCRRRMGVPKRLDHTTASGQTHALVERAWSCDGMHRLAEGKRIGRVCHPAFSGPKVTKSEASIAGMPDRVREGFNRNGKLDWLIDDFESNIHITAMHRNLWCHESNAKDVWDAVRGCWWRADELWNGLQMCNRVTGAYYAVEISRMRARHKGENRLGVLVHMHMLIPGPVPSLNQDNLETGWMLDGDDRRGDLYQCTMRETDDEEDRRRLFPYVRGVCLHKSAHIPMPKILDGLLPYPCKDKPTREWKKSGGWLRPEQLHLMLAGLAYPRSPQWRGAMLRRDRAC